MHSWGDDFLYFGEVGDAANYIGVFCRKWGRIGVRQTKEKWGTVRVYCGFGAGQFHTLTYPGYVYSQYPHWLWVLDLRFSYSWFGQIFWSGINKILLPWQKFIYRKAYSNALKKYPMIRKEILACPDYRESLEGL